MLMKCEEQIHELHFMLGWIWHGGRETVGRFMMGTRRSTDQNVETLWRAPAGRIFFGQVSCVYGTCIHERNLTVSDQSEIPTADAVEVFVASLRQRSVPVNTVKSYAHDLRLFVQVVPSDLSAVTPEAIEAFLAGNGHLSPATRRRRYSTLCT